MDDGGGDDGGGDDGGVDDSGGGGPNEAPLSRGRDCMVPIWPSSSFLFWTGLPTA